MLSIYPRGEIFHIDYSQGAVHLVRGTLGTKHKDVALRYHHRLEIAIAEGSKSSEWLDLSRSGIPSKTLGRFAAFFGVKSSTSWKQFRELFEAHKKRQLSAGEIVTTTIEHHTRALDYFETFLQEKNISIISGIDGTTIEEFKSQLFQRLSQSRRFTKGTSLRFYTRMLHHAFGYAVESGLIEKNPIKITRNRRCDDTDDADPLTGQELNALRLHAGADMLMLLVLRWTGFRRSDAVILKWDEVDFTAKEIEHVCKKNRVRVRLPIPKELLNALCAEYEIRKPAPDDTVLLNPHTKRPFGLEKINRRLAMLGKRSGVRHVHPHRFRDTFAVDLILRGASEYYVAKMLGDTEGIVVKHYLKFVKELREKTRAYLDNEGGLEQCLTPSQLPMLSS